MKGFLKNETKILTACVKKACDKGEPLCSAFKKCAEKTGRASGSVRNYYYRVLAKERDDLPKVNSALKFTQKEEVELVRSVLKARLKFGSTRKAITYLAGGNQALALRYQNKFAVMLKKQRALVMREVLLQKQREGECFNPYFEQSKRLKNQKQKLKRA